MSSTAVMSEGHVLLRGVSWTTYEALSSEAGRGGTRFTYDRGDLEIMSPSERHERLKTLLGRMIEILTFELGIPIRSTGSTTLRLEPTRQGLEPDESYYVTSEPLVRGRSEIRIPGDPPPDLAVEVEITAAWIDKRPIYSELGIPEIWRHDGESLRVERLRPDGTYETAEKSGVFPFLPMREVEGFLARCDESDETTWLHGFRDWVRRTLRP